MNDMNRAAAYAALKLLEKMDNDNQLSLPPGTYNVSGQQITLTLPPDTIIERAEGENGDGVVSKPMVQNLYGWTFLAILIRVLKKFNQWKAVRRCVAIALGECLTGPQKFREVIARNDDKIEEEIEAIKGELRVPNRPEPTRRYLKGNKLGIPLGIVFRQPRQKTVKAKV